MRWVLVATSMIAVTVMPGPAAAASCAGYAVNPTAIIEGTAQLVDAGDGTHERWRFDGGVLYGPVTTDVAITITVNYPYDWDAGSDKLRGVGTAIIDRMVPGARYRVGAMGDATDLWINDCGGWIMRLDAPAPTAPRSETPVWIAPTFLGVVGIGILIGRRRRSVRPPERRDWDDFSPTASSF